MGPRTGRVVEGRDLVTGAPEVGAQLGVDGRVAGSLGEPESRGRDGRHRSDVAGEPQQLDLGDRERAGDEDVAVGDGIGERTVEQRLAAGCAAPSQHARQDAGGEVSHRTRSPVGGHERSELVDGLVPRPGVDVDHGLGEPQPVLAGEELDIGCQPQARRDVPEGFVEATGSMAAAGGVDPDPHLVLDARIADAQRHGVGEIADAPLVAERQPAAAEVGERLAAQVVAAQTSGQVDRVLGDAQRSWIGLGHDADGREVAVPAGQVGEGTGQTNVVVARREEVDGSL